MHARELKDAGESDERSGVGAWRESPYFGTPNAPRSPSPSPVTRLADLPDSVPDAVLDDAADIYDEK